MIQAFRFFYENSAHIDVFRKDKLELVHFILLPYTKAMPKDKKVDFHDNVDRSNTKSKVSDLADIANEIIEICKHEEWLMKSRNPLLKFFYKYIPFFKEISFLMTLVINFAIFLSFSDEFGDRMKDIHLF